MALTAELGVGIKPGYRLVSGAWNSRTYTSLAQGSRRMIPARSLIRGEVPVDNALSQVQIRNIPGSWSFSHHFEQFVDTRDDFKVKPIAPLQ